MRCAHCRRRLVEGDTAYEVQVRRIQVRGTRVVQADESIYVCESCQSREAE